jgi:hypothetical protein
MGDNFIDPENVVGTVDLHAEAIDAIMQLIAEARRAYSDNLRVLFGLDVDPHAVAVSMREIELTWDAVCVNAVWAPKLWWKSWRDSFLNAQTGPGPILDGWPRVRQGFGLHWQDVHSMSGSLTIHGDPRHQANPYASGHQD